MIQISGNKDLLDTSVSIILPLQSFGSSRYELFFITADKMAIMARICDSQLYTSVHNTIVYLCAKYGISIIA